MKSYKRNTTFRFAAVLLFSLLAMASVAVAQLPVPASSQFDITGFLQEATVTSTGDAHSGGTLKINGHTVTVPRETIVILPANALTWQEMFANAPAPYTGVATGMALADVPAPLTTYEFEVIGNRVGDTYIAGLIFMSQQALNSGAGFINFINYATGEMRVGGQIVVDGLGNPVLSGTNPGTRVRLNDPVGRYGRVMSPDVRFTVDPDNPTIMASTGYPMCLPRTAPVGGVTTDALCPEGNRPITVAASPTSPAVYSTNFTTNNLTNPGFPAFPGVFPDSTKQAPFEVGDWITFAGTLVTDNANPTTGPYPGTANTYISAHTIVNNVAIYTFPSSNPAYVMTEVTLIGTGGLTVLGAGEAVIRTRFEGMTTDVDPSGAAQRKIHLYGIDLTSAGVTSDRDWGTIGVDPGPPIGAVKGRWRFRPPCLPFGSVPTRPDKDCVMNQAGTFLPPTREMRSVIEGLQSQDPANPGALTSANGLFYGQYHAPIMLYIFPENVPGAPIVENNFNSIPFLACGGYTSSGIPGGAGTLVGILNPWPSNITPNTSSCVGLVVAPSNVVATATPSSVISGTGTLVTLNATAAGTLPLSFAWTQAPTDVPQVVLTNPNTDTATFTTPVVAANTTLHFTVTVTNSAGSASGVTSVAVAVDIPIVNHVPPQTVFSGTPVTMIITGTDPAGLPLTFAVTQTAGPAPNPPGLVLTQNPPSGATLNFTYTLPIGAPAATLNFSIVATNTAGASSAAEFTSVTVNPLPDSLSITNAEYRTAKQRLIVNVTDATVNPAINVFLNPYRCEVNSPPCTPQANGTWMYNPDPAAGGVGNVFTFAPGGLYTIDVTGAPKPACNLGGTYATPCGVASINVRSSQGGTASSVLTKIRQ
ncbi:MAG: hypothetical protein ACXV7C_01900 [Candidatus Angelobacter sp.]